MNLLERNFLTFQVLNHRIGCKRAFSSTPGSLKKYHLSNPLNSAYFTTDYEWAAKIAKAAGLTSEGLQRKSTSVLQVNPGNGPLTKCLLAERSNFITAWEPRSIYWDHLDLLTEQHATHYEYRKKAFIKEKSFNLSKFGDPDSSVHKTVVIGNFDSMRDAVSSLVFQFSHRRGIWQLGNIDFFLIVTGFEYRLITEASWFWQRKQFLRTSLYNLFFDSKLIMTIPISVFNQNSVTDCIKSLKFDRENMYLMNLTLKTGDGFFGTSCKETRIIGVIRLLMWINRHRRHRVISTFENLCPGVGLQLIQMSVTMMDCFSDISVSLWPVIYDVLIANENYPFSPLKHIMDGTDKLHIGDSNQEM